MKKKIFALIIILALSFVFTFFDQPYLSFSKDELLKQCKSETSVPPIFDGSADPDLHFSHKGGDYVAQNVDYVYEVWEKNKWTVTIERWFTKSSDAVSKYAKRNQIDDWDKIVEIGDKTSWLKPGMVVFAKGKVLVKVYVVVYDQIPDEQMKNYTRHIAKSIEKKL